MVLVAKAKRNAACAQVWCVAASAAGGAVAVFPPRARAAASPAPAPHSVRAPLSAAAAPRARRLALLLCLLFLKWIQWTPPGVRRGTERTNWNGLIAAVLGENGPMSSLRSWTCRARCDRAVFVLVDIWYIRDSVLKSSIFEKPTERRWSVTFTPHSA